MPWLVAFAVVGVIYLWDRAAKAATSAAQDAIYWGGVTQGATPARAPQSVAPFVAGGPPATYNFDSAALNWANGPVTQAMHVGDTMTLTLPWMPSTGVGWIVTVADSVSGPDTSQSAVYPFGNMWPGLGMSLASPALPPSATITYGFTAIKPGVTTLSFMPSQAGAPMGGAYRVEITVKP